MHALIASVAVVVASLTATPAPQSQLVNVRTGRHATYDRVVFEWNGPVPSRRIRSVREVTQDASGQRIAVEGRRLFRIVFDHAVAHTDEGRPSFTLTRNHARLPTLRDVEPAGDFEAVVGFGVGANGSGRYRVFTLRNPSRVVIDFLR